MRKIYLLGEVNETMYATFTTELDELLSTSSTKPVQVELSSEGGTVLDALAIVGRIVNAPCPIHVTVYGKCMSAAVLILACADKRSVSSEAWIMHHEDTLRVKGSTTDLQRMAARAEQDETHWGQLLGKYTKVDEVHWRAWARKTTYFTASEALAMGLVDEVLKGKK